MRSSTPSSTAMSTLNISTGAIIGITIGAIVCISLCILMYYFCTIYCFYISDPRSRPEFLYTHNVEERDCGTIACVNVNRSLILCCCPSLKKTVENTNLYQQGGNNITFTSSNADFLNNQEMNTLLGNDRC